MSTSRATEIAEHYIKQAADAFDVGNLDLVRRAGLDSIYALNAAGLMSSTESGEALNRLVDACHHRYGELMGVRP